MWWCVNAKQVQNVLIENTDVVLCFLYSVGTLLSLFNVVLCFLYLMWYLVSSVQLHSPTLAYTNTHTHTHTSYLTHTLSLSLAHTHTLHSNSVKAQPGLLCILQGSGGCVPSHS